MYYAFIDHIYLFIAHIASIN